jgi:hypothetical protein
LKKRTKKLPLLLGMGCDGNNAHAPASKNFFASFFIKKEALPLLLTLGLASCASPDSHAPIFAQRDFAPFSRADAVAVAMDEWRLWGQHVGRALCAG